jgi:hypothetical protein
VFTSALPSNALRQAEEVDSVRGVGGGRGKRLGVGNKRQVVIVLSELE